MTVAPAQRGIAYHYTVVDRRGMRHDAFDLADAYTLADEWADRYCSGAHIEDADGNIVAYTHYLRRMTNP